jgi:hypothetical protein
MKRTAKSAIATIRERDRDNRSARWFQDMIRQVGLNTNNPHRIMQSGIGKFVGSVVPGSMFLFLYDPKTKDRLPYYDTVPIVVVFQHAPGGFIGLNLHYLSPVLRYNLLLQLMLLVRDTTITSSTRMQLSWSLLQNANRFPGAEVCVKRYLYSHLQSRLLKINPVDWKTAVMLPIDNFVRASRLSVFTKSRRTIG